MCLPLQAFYVRTFSVGLFVLCVGMEILLLFVYVPTPKSSCVALEMNPWIAWGQALECSDLSMLSYFC